MGSALGAEPNISDVYIGNIWRMRADWAALKFLAGLSAKPGEQHSPIDWYIPLL